MVKSTFTNELSWSFSRHRLLSDCPRAYYWDKYGSWGGWADSATPQARQAYRLKKLTGLPLWKGDLVHRAIEQYLGVFSIADKHRGSTIPSLVANDVRLWIDRTATTEWQQSECAAVRPPNPSRSLALCEHYYPELRHRIKPQTLHHTIAESIELFDNFLNSPLHEPIMVVGPGEWLTLELLDSFEVDGAKVWVKLDFAFNSRKNRVVVLDWKTGSRHEMDAGQLAIYSLYIRDKAKWVANLADLVLMDVYLKEGRGKSILLQHPVATAESLSATAVMIKASLKKMRALLSDPVANAPKPISSFKPCSKDRHFGKCAYCNFRELCYGKEVY